MCFEQHNNGNSGDTWVFWSGPYFQNNLEKIISYIDPFGLHRKGYIIYIIIYIYGFC